MELIIYIAAIANPFKLSFGLFILCSLIMGFVSGLRKLFSKNLKKVLLYAVFVLITFALTALLSSSKVLNDTPSNSFYGFQFIFLLLGILHVYILQKYFEELSRTNSVLLSEILFTVAYMCIGLIAFTNIVYRFRAPFSIIFMASSIFFIIPILFYKLYEFAMEIPVPVYKQWVFPLSNKIKDPTKAELANPLVISFEFKKKRDDNDIISFKVKAPQNMEFGKLFYFFILDYNERHPENTIEYLDNISQNPQGWIFYYKPNWWSPLRHINFTHTVAANNILENTEIICDRVSN